jgi:hypothetical protein
MNGKYGWFDATYKYNLPRYYSGIDYETAENLNKAEELRNNLKVAKDEPIYKIELSKQGFDEKTINELKNRGIINSEILPEIFYINAEKNKDFIKGQVKELSTLPKPEEKFNPVFNRNGGDSFLTDEEKQARQNEHSFISGQGENYGSSYERRNAHQDIDLKYNEIFTERYKKAKQDFLKQKISPMI